MILVDTSGWFAVLVPSDPNATAAQAWYQANTERLLTTDYVVDELLTLLKLRQGRARAVAAGQHFFSGALGRIEYITPDDVDNAWQVFERFSDKDWSFTDCASYVVIQRLGKSTAFAFDQHFAQFGIVTVVP